MVTVEKLDELLKSHLGRNKTVVDYETTKLTAIGENYGSLMLALKCHIKNNQTTETLELVAKVPPPGEFIQKMFNIPVTFKNEVNFYKVIIPELEAFLQEKGFENYLDCFPKLYGARLNLTDTDNVNDDAALLLENLKLIGYSTAERTVGFDLQTARTVLKSLAKMHAVPLAMKILKPQTFQNRIKSFFTPYKVFDISNDMYTKALEKIFSIIQQIDSCKQYYDAVRQLFCASNTQEKNNPKVTREPWATIIHTDAWVNNFMVKGSTSCKIVDFQLYEYGSPARDILFFIYSSVQIAVVKEQYDDLVNTYHGTLVGILNELGCDSGAFSLQEFHKEIQLVAKESEFLHVTFMLEPVFATKDSLKELDQYKEEDMVEEKAISAQYKEKAAFVVEEFCSKILNL